MGQTIAEKLAQLHLAAGPGRPLRAGDVVSLRPRHVMTHDNTSAVMAKFRAIGASHPLDQTSTLGAELPHGDSVPIKCASPVRARCRQSAASKVARAERKRE